MMKNTVAEMKKYTRRNQQQIKRRRGINQLAEDRVVEITDAKQKKKKKRIRRSKDRPLRYQVY